MRIDIILDRLEKVRPSGNKQWMACCPSHADKSPSLGLKELSDGRILINCLAGCGAADVLHSIGLTLSDLYPDGALGEYQSFESLKRKIEAKPNSKLEHAKTVLAISQAMRKEGQRLSREDLDTERRAWEVVNANGKR